jgi:hypothetical protein
MSRWHEPLTKTEQARLDTACARIHTHFGSYSRIAAALMEQTGQFISDETVRNYLIEGKIPPHIAATLSDLVPGVEFLELVPWLVPYCSGLKP